MSARSGGDEEEAVGEMLSSFPNDDRLRVATEPSVDAAVAQLRAEMHSQTVHLVTWMIGIAIALATVMLSALALRPEGGSLSLGGRGRGRSRGSRRR